MKGIENFKTIENSDFTWCCGSSSFCIHKIQPNEPNNRKWQKQQKRKCFKCQQVSSLGGKRYYQPQD